MILLQETHTKSDSDILSRGSIEGYSLVAALHSPVYGIATYVQNNIEEFDKYGHVFLIAINISGTTIINIYKPPSSVWPDNMIPVFDNPCIYSGDMNCHHIQWGYRYIGITIIMENYYQRRTMTERGEGGERYIPGWDKNCDRLYDDFNFYAQSR